MALEEAILEFFSAGVAALGAQRHDGAVPQAACPVPGDLVDRLVSAGMGANSRELLSDVARDMRGVIASGRQPLTEIERHMRALPELIASYPPDADSIAYAIEYYRTHEPGKPNGQEPPALVLAQQVAEAADEDGTPARLQLDPVLMVRLIEILFARLLANAGFLESATPAIQSVAGQEAADEVDPLGEAADPEPPGTAEPESFAAPSQDGLPQELSGMLIRLHSETGVPLSALAALMRAQAERGGRPTRMEAALKEKAAALKDLVRRISRPGAPDSILQRLRSEAVAALEEGKLDEADQLLSGAEARLLTSGTPGREQARTTSELRCQRAALEDLRLEHRKAAAHYEVAARSLASDDPEGRWSCTLRQGSALQAEAEEHGDDEALGLAIVTFARALELAPRASAPEHWAITQNHLGNALLTLGERERSTDKLALAEKSYRLALEVRTRGNAPQEWALLNSNLGTVLLKAGEIEGSPDRFRAAAASFRAALEEFSREATPADWALTQMNLATALSRLSAHDDDVRPLEGAATAFTAALEECSREERPEEWARIENSLGNVLSELGERTGDARWLDLAVTAYREALAIWRRDDPGVEWALATANLGNALWALGEMHADAGLMGEAAEVMLSALEQFRERGEEHYERTALDNLRALREAMARLGGRAAVGS